MINSRFSWKVLNFFPPIFGAPGVGPSFSWRDTFCVCIEMFSPPRDSNLSSLALIGVFPHSPGSTGSGHFFTFLYTILTRLGSCCKFGPLVSLLDNRMGVRSTRVRTIVCTHLEKAFTLGEPMIYQRP